MNKQDMEILIRLGYFVGHKHESNVQRVIAARRSAPITLEDRHITLHFPLSSEDGEEVFVKRTLPINSIQLHNFMSHETSGSSLILMSPIVLMHEACVDYFDLTRWIDRFNRGPELEQ